ncbi:hypothetical protein Aros01_04614 [Streptosporangium roseum]
MPRFRELLPETQSRRSRKPPEQLPETQAAPALPGPYAGVLAEYAAALEHSPPADSSKTKYHSRLRGYLAWSAGQADAGALDGDPLTDPIAATGAVCDFRRHLKNGRRPQHSRHLSVGHRRHLRPSRRRQTSNPARTRLPPYRTPRALGERRARRHVRHAQLTAGPHDRALALLPYLARSSYSHGEPPLGRSMSAAVWCQNLGPHPAEVYERFGVRAVPAEGVPRCGLRPPAGRSPGQAAGPTGVCPCASAARSCQSVQVLSRSA